MELLQFVENSNTFGNIASIGPHCIICNCGSPTYVDLGLITSVTSHSETPLKEKIKHILNNKWVSAISEAAYSLCLECFPLVDQYDTLEAQLKIIHNDICNKYVNGHGVIHTVQTCEKPVSEHCTVSPVNGERTKRTVSSKRTTGSKRKKASLDSNIPTLHAQIVQLEPEARRDRGPEAPALVQWHTTPVAVYEAAGAGAGPGTEPAPPPLLITGLPVGGALPVAWTGDAAADACPGLRILTLENPPTATSDPVGQVAAEQAVDDPGLPDAALGAAGIGGDAFADQQPLAPMPTRPQPPPPSQPPPLAVYDDSLAGLQPGERVRLGTAVAGAEDAEEGDVVAAVTAAPAFACCYCAGVFTDAVALRQHARAVHRPVVLTANLPPHLGLGPKANCGVELAAVEPTASEHARPFVCLFCDGAFKFKSNIHLHYKDKHTPHKPFACPDCHDTFRRSIELSRHRVYYCPHRKKSAPEPRRR